VLNREVGDCPEMDVSMEGHVIRCLVDTGSQVTTITESFYKQLSKSKPTLQVTNAWMTVRGANQLEVPYVGYIEVTVVLCGQTLPNVGVLVLKDPVGSIGANRKRAVPGVLGSNVFRMMKEMGVVSFN
jgi:hypothetical protein